MVEKIKEVELKLLATNKELEEYKALAKYNEKCFKVYQNDHSSKCQCSTVIDELQVTLRKKDDELNECKKTMSKNEQIIKQNQIRINECERMLTNQVVQMEIFRSKAEVIEEELELYDWTIDLSELFENGDILDKALIFIAFHSVWIIIKIKILWRSIYIVAEIITRKRRGKGGSKLSKGSITIYMLYVTVK